MKTRAWSSLAAALVVAAATLAGCGSDSSAVDDDMWVVGRMPCSSDCGFLRMSEEKGFYEEQGVKVKFVELKSAAQVYPALAAGEVDAIEQSPGGLFIAEEQGGMDAKVIGSSMTGMPFAIFAQNKYDTMKDLEGQSVGISSPTGLPALVAKLMLEDAGVDWNSIEPVNAGGNPDRYRAVVAGTVAATADASDYIPQAKEDKVNVLALSADVIPDYPRYTIIARNDSLEEKGDLATRYMAGLIAGLRYSLDQPDETAKVSAQASDVAPDDPTVTFTQDLVVDKKLIDPDGGVDMPKLEYLQQVLLDAGELKEPVDLDSLVDDSFQQAALERLDK